MGDRALEVLRGIYHDLTDRSGLSLDDIPDDIKAGMLSKWYSIIHAGINPGSEAPAPSDILAKVRGW
jgi:hypothetical protein